MSEELIMDDDKTMEWIPVHEPDSTETVYVMGYECSHCGYFSRTPYARCPFCKRNRDEKAEPV